MAPLCGPQRPGPAGGDRDPAGRVLQSEGAAPCRPKALRGASELEARQAGGGVAGVGYTAA